MNWFDQLGEWEQAAVSLSAIGTAVVPLWYAARKVHRCARRKATEVLAGLIGETLASALRPLETKVAEIYDQITINGHTRNTLRDKFSNIEEAIHYIGEIQRANLENSPQARFECDATGRCVWVNESLCALFGQSSNTMTDLDGKGWLRSIKEAAIVFDHWMDAVKTGVPYQQAYTVTNATTGRDVPCIAVARPTYAKDGRTIRRWNGSVNPIADEKLTPR